MGGSTDNDSSSSNDEVIFDVKPLRSLSPMFPAPYGCNTISPPATHPFVYVTPFGSFTSGSDSGYQHGVCTLIPNSLQTPNERPPANPVPISSDIGAANGYRRPKPRGRPRKVPREDDGQLITTPSSVPHSKVKQPSPLSQCEIGSSSIEAIDGKKGKRKRYVKVHENVQPLPSASHDDKESVNMVLMTFDALRRRITQLYEMKGMGLNRHPYLKAGSIMSKHDLRANTVRRIGSIPGVEIGDLFYFRIEMCLVGLHRQTIAGIDYMTVRFNDDDDPVALSIVSAGGYENEDGDLDVLIYSGHGGGGGNKSDQKQKDDQKLERGNLALERSLHRANLIRVIRTEKDFSTQNGKIYIYDGLYKIQQSWLEKGKSGFNIFKYKLMREPEQPDGIATWKKTQKWKENPSSRGNVILPDVSSGMEKLPVILVNDVDDEKGPTHFVYSTKLKYLSPIGAMKTLPGCNCQSVCLPGNEGCSCVQRNESNLPFGLNGLLVSRKPLIYECSPSCQCSINCRNRVTQKGIILHFEIFRTKDRGWGLRSWDPIRAGSFVCEYIGEVIDKIKVEEEEEEDEYIFHTMHADGKEFKWNYRPELLKEPSHAETSEVSKPLPIIISAKKMGNVSRFMNHSCSPNVFWQPVQHDHDHEGYPHIMFFAIKHIPPMTELTYDYGPSGVDIGLEKMGPRVGSRGMKTCLCGSHKCRGSFF